MEVNYVPDFILAGASADLNNWPTVAENIGVLWCIEHEQNAQESPGCKANHCPGFDCGIDDGTVRLKVYEIRSATNFDESPYEQLYLLTASKYNAVTEVASARLLVQKFVAAFPTGSVTCFESQGSQRELVWTELESNKST